MEGARCELSCGQGPARGASSRPCSRAVGAVGRAGRADAPCGGPARLSEHLLQPLLARPASGLEARPPGRAASAAPCAESARSGRSSRCAYRAASGVASTSRGCTDEHLSSDVLRQARDLDRSSTSTRRPPDWRPTSPSWLRPSARSSCAPRASPPASTRSRSASSELERRRLEREIKAAGEAEDFDRQRELSVERSRGHRAIARLMGSEEPARLHHGRPRMSTAEHAFQLRRAGGRGEPRARTRRALAPTPVRTYLKEIGGVSLLSAKDEVRLAKLIEKGDQRRQERADRGQPAARRVGRQALHGPRAEPARPDPGGQPRPDPRGREVRLPQGLQVLDLRDLVDPPGGLARDRRPGAHDPDPGPHGRRDQPRHAHAAPAAAGPRPRADAGGDRQASSTCRREKVEELLRAGARDGFARGADGRHGRFAGRLHRGRAHPPAGRGRRPTR